MKIEYYNTTNNMININFNKLFKQIKFVKMELLNENSTDATMESEEMEFKYTKNKSNINVFFSSKNFVIILVKEIDNISVMYSYYLNISQSCSLGQENEVLFSGLSSILKNHHLHDCKDDYKDTKKLIDCQIKNENIFAKITKK